MFRNRNVIAATAASGMLILGAVPAAAEVPSALAVAGLRPLAEAPFEPLRPVVAPRAEVARAPRPSRAERRLERAYSTLHRRAERRDLEPGRDIVDDGVRDGRRARSATKRELRGSIRDLREMLSDGQVSRPAPGGGSGQGGGGASAQLEAIAACESGGDPSSVGGGGQYRGKYQFDRSTWAAVGGSGDPAAAPEAEQDRRAAALIAQQGTSAWPNCG